MSSTCRARHGLKPGSGSPLVEGAESGTAVNLEIHLVLDFAVQRPVGGIPEVAPEDQRHAVLGHFFRALDFGGRIDAGHIGEDLVEAASEIAFLDLFAQFRLNCFQTLVLAVKRDQPFGSGGEEHALFQHLYLRAQFEHLPGWGIGGIIDINAFQHVLDRVAGSGLDRALVDRAGDDEIRAEHQNGRSRFRRTDAAGRADKKLTEIRETLFGPRP